MVRGAHPTELFPEKILDISIDDFEMKSLYNFSKPLTGVSDFYGLKNHLM